MVHGLGMVEVHFQARMQLKLIVQGHMLLDGLPKVLLLMGSAIDAKCKFHMPLVLLTHSVSMLTAMELLPKVNQLLY
jgi:hypothetical protein